jgi:membrane associated rhomboid family serine protease
MKVSAVSLLLLLLLLLPCFLLLFTQEPVTCTVQGSGHQGVNGFYSARNGMYSKTGYSLTSVPDAFGIMDIKHYKDFYEGVIIFVKGNWLISAGKPVAKVVYHTDPAIVDINLHHPPVSGWMAASADMPTPSKVTCSGNLEDSPRDESASGNNIGALMARPVTTLLLCIIFYYAYYLWSNRVDVAAVAYSYELIMLRGEYWRMVSASFSHFDLLHLGFNCMALYQLGMLEPIYSSFTFAYLNLALVFLTMAICLAIHGLLIYRRGRQEYLSQLAVGYSCVLFAWMVALSVRLPEYCPIFFLPSFCLKTYHLALPFLPAAWAFPVNFGPFLLLIVTQLLLTRASFIGHLAGILIGYPLAWHLLDWLDPLRLAGLLVAAFLAVEGLSLPKYLAAYRGQVLGPALAAPADFLEAAVVGRHRRFIVGSAALWLAAAVQLFVLSGADRSSAAFWVTALLQLGLLGYLMAAAVVARRLSFYSTAVLAEAGRVHLALLAFLLALGLWQYAGLLLLVLNSALLTANGLTAQQLSTAQLGLAALLALEIAYAAGCLFPAMAELPLAAQWLAAAKFDGRSFSEDLDRLRGLCGRPRVVEERQDLTVFVGSAGNRLHAQAQAQAQANPLHDRDVESNLPGPVSAPPQSISSLLSALRPPADGVRYQALPTAEPAASPSTSPDLLTQQSAAQSDRKLSSDTDSRRRELLAKAAMSRRSPPSSDKEAGGGRK